MTRSSQAYAAAKPKLCLPWQSCNYPAAAMNEGNVQSFRNRPKQARKLWKVCKIESTAEDHARLFQPPLPDAKVQALRSLGMGDLVAEWVTFLYFFGGVGGLGV